ncbi:DUF6531 domain-containing protein (plasmid) [Tenacibaculum finnmarkense]|nr:DUF6531 domain-containing protein [Tenacibaculum finnmarkense]
MANDKSFFEQTSSSIELSVGKQIDGLGKAAQDASAISNNDQLTGATKAKAQIVNAADAGVQAFGAITGLADNLTESAILPILSAIGMKGIASLPISKQLDPVIGIDMHMVVYPPVPAPIPLPHPYVGMLFRPKDFVAAAIASFIPAPPEPVEGAPNDEQQNQITKNKAIGVGHALATIAVGMIGATVKIGGAIPRVVAGTPTKSIPHFALAPAFHPVFSRAVAKDHGHAFLGSLLALADNDPISGGGAHLHFSCWDIGTISPHTARPSKNTSKKVKFGAKLYAPTSVIMPIPMERTIITSPVPAPFNPMAAAQKALLGSFGRHFKKLKKKVADKAHTAVNKKIGSGKLQNAVHKSICTVTGHPVDVASGMFFTDEEDFFLPEPIPISWERTWYSKSDYKGPLGNGWHHNYDIGIIIESGIATLRMQDGRPIAFELPHVGNPTVNIAEQLELHKNEQGEYYIWNIKEDVYYYFTKQTYNDISLIRSIVNTNSFSIQFTYNRDGHLTQITDSAHRTLTIENNATGQITKIIAPHQTFRNQHTTIAKYMYDSEGNMIQQTNAVGDSMFFEYENKLMVKETWRNGLNWFFKYDGTSIGARCIHTWGDGNLYNHKLTFFKGCTHVENSLGHTTEYYHKNGLVHKQIDPNGAEEVWVYDENNLLLSQADPMGNATLYSYDKAGNNTQTISPTGATLELEYDLQETFAHLPLKAKDANGGVWKWKYDSQGNVIERTNPLGAKSKTIYKNGLVHQVIDSLEVVTTLQYDAQYNITQVTDSLGNTTKYNYDFLGNCIEIQNPKGAIQKRDFDPLGRIEKVYDYDGNEISMAYDGIDNLLQYQDQHQKVKYSYRGMWKLTSRSDNRGTTRYNYNTEEQLTQITNEKRNTYRFFLDKAGHTIEETSFDQESKLFKRDLAGKVTELTSPTGKKTAYSYDKGNNITQITYHNQETNQFIYNPAGQLIQAINKDAEVSFKHNILGLIETETVNEHSINHQYNNIGRRIGLQSSMGANINYQHDAFGNLANLTAQQNNNQWQAKYEHDSLGFELEKHLPGKLTQSFNYDAIGRLTNQTTLKEKQRRHERRYTWGVNDRLQQTNDSKHGITKYSYTPTGHLENTKFNDGTEQLRTLDAVGNLYDTKDHSNREYSTWDTRLTKKGSWHYVYDNDGFLIEKYKGSSGWFGTKTNRWKYNWNAQGMLQTVTRPDGIKVHFTYDALGRRLTKTFKSTTTKWLWDGNVPLHEWKENQFGTILSSAKVDDDGIITWVFEENSFIPTAKFKNNKTFSILADHLGTPTSMCNEEGETTWVRSLDSNGKVREGDNSSCPFLFQGQYYDEEIELAYNRFRYYNPDDGRYISQDPIGLLSDEFNFYAYIKDSNSYVDVFGLSGNNYRNLEIGKLPRLRGKNLKKIEALLLERGFVRTNPANPKNKRFKHADGSEVQIHAYGNQNMTPHKGGNNAHVHKSVGKHRDNGTVELDDDGVTPVSPYSSEAHIGAKNPSDFESVSGKQHGD